MTIGTSNVHCDASASQPTSGCYLCHQSLVDPRLGQELTGGKNGGTAPALAAGSTPFDPYLTQTPSCMRVSPPLSQSATSLGHQHQSIGGFLSADGLPLLISDFQSSRLPSAGSLLSLICGPPLAAGLLLTSGSFVGLSLATTFGSLLTLAPLASNIRATVKDNTLRNPTLATVVLSLCLAVGSASERKYLAALTGPEEKVVVVAEEGEAVEEVAKLKIARNAAEGVAKEEFAVSKEEEITEALAKEEFAEVTVAKRVDVRVHFNPSTNFPQKVFKNSTVPHLHTFVKSATQTTKTSCIVLT